MRSFDLYLGRRINTGQGIYAIWTAQRHAVPLRLWTHAFMQTRASFQRMHDRRGKVAQYADAIIGASRA